MGYAIRLVLVAAFALAAGHGATAQVLTDAPKPIETPPIPAPPQIGPAPGIIIPLLQPPPVPVIAIPGPADLSIVPEPKQAEITPADKNDPIAAPQSAALTGAPPKISPGADPDQIQEMAFILDPGSSTIPVSAQAKLLDTAKTMKSAPESRIEVRAYSPEKPHRESDARRLSLSRFLAVRDFLVRHGIDDNRIDGRALTSEPTELNADRIELYIER